MKDEEVLVASRTEPALFKILIDRYEAAFLRRARRILGAREEVSDVVVETFTKIYINADTFKPQPGASFKSWAYRVLTNTTLTYYRKLKVTGERSVHPEPEYWALASAPDNFEERLGAKDWVASVLTRMPVKLARVLRSHFIEGEPQQAIAAREGLTLGAVKTRIHRAKKVFKKISLLLDNQK
jgi:RNA polymerase sigma-70 factor (ECF subfamily)